MRAWQVPVLVFTNLCMIMLTWLCATWISTTLRTIGSPNTLLNQRASVFKYLGGGLRSLWSPVMVPASPSKPRNKLTALRLANSQSIGCACVSVLRRAIVRALFANQVEVTPAATIGGYLSLFSLSLVNPLGCTVFTLTVPQIEHRILLALPESTSLDLMPS